MRDNGSVRHLSNRPRLPAASWTGPVRGGKVPGRPSGTARWPRMGSGRQQLVAEHADRRDHGQQAGGHGSSESESDEW